MTLKSTFTGLLLAAASLARAQGAAEDLPVRVISWNVRFDASSGERQTGEGPWSDRGPLVIQTLKKASDEAGAGAPTIIGLQEALKNQVDDIIGGLGAGWKLLGVGRDDGVNDGEFEPIAYREDLVKLVDSKIQWLSETPDEPSRGFDAGSNRMITVGVFEQIGAPAAGRRFIAANTHLDNAGAEARVKGVGIILAAIQSMQDQYGPGLGVVLTGDFNSGPGGDAYNAMVADGELQELKPLVPTDKVTGPDGTFTTFDLTKTAGRIDFQWIGPSDAQKFSPVAFTTIDNIFGSVIMSDHRAVQSDLLLKA